MAYTTIDDPSAYFQADTYTGTGSSLANTFDGNSNLQPDLVWIKERTAASHVLCDSTRGTSSTLFSDHEAVESTSSEYVTAFGSDGFTVGTEGIINSSSDTYVAWGWKANGGTRSTFSESGGNPAGGYQANTTSKFSIVDYVGTSNAGNNTKANCLGVAPKFIIIKDRDVDRNWAVYHAGMASDPETDNLELNTDVVKADDADYWNDTAPTSSVFSVKDAHDVNYNDRNYIAYVWAEVQGYSKFGSVSGNGSANGPFVYTGFKPAYVLIKNASQEGRWCIFDNKRPGNYNAETADVLYANYSSAEYTGTDYFGMEFSANGFKLTETDSEFNDTGDIIVFAAFAEQPFVTSGEVPATAR